MATEGGHAEGQEGAHKLKGWTHESVTMVDSARRLQEFQYPTKVILPEETQQEMYDCMMPPLVDAWINTCTNIMVLAYGQTCTGKTHTMLGPQDSLKAHDFHPEWGILPRVVHECFSAIDATKGSKSYLLIASAVEFYAGMCCDLLNHHTSIEVDGEGAALGVHGRVMHSMDDFYVFLDDVKQNRVTRATKMNTESSRSHCAMCMSLYQLDHASRMFTMTRFNLFDLAGSERADKTGERATPDQCMTELWAVMMGKRDPSEVSVGVQGFFINFELEKLATEILRATDMYKAGRKYNPPRGCSTAFQRYVGEVLTGHSLLNTCICISPALQSGSENLFSLKWGQNMARLKAPINAEKPIPVDAAYQAACDLADKTAKELEKKDKSNKYYHAYSSRAGSAAQRKEYLERLMASAS
jgi:hypothetical protein